MSCGLLTGAISIGRQMPFPDEIRRALLHNSPAVSAWCAVTVEGDRNLDLGSPHLRCVHSCQGSQLPDCCTASDWLQCSSGERLQRASVWVTFQKELLSFSSFRSDSYVSSAACIKQKTSATVVEEFDTFFIQWFQLPKKPKLLG